MMSGGVLSCFTCVSVGGDGATNQRGGGEERISQSPFEDLTCEVGQQHQLMVAGVAGVAASS